MKVSVIVPVYNVEDYLSECLQSLVDQTLSELEILVVDDGSTDASGEIIARFARQYPERIRAFHKENGGQASARNLALTKARGQYLGFVDSDDWVDLSMYEQMWQTAVKNDLDIVICDLDDHFPDGIVVHHRPSQASNKFHQTPSACNKLFRRALVADQQFLQGLWYEDFNFTTKLLFCTDQIGYCAHAFYHCHCRLASTMTNHNAPKNLDILTVLDDIINFAQNRGLYCRYQEPIEFMVLDHVLITSINRVAKQTPPEKNNVIRKLRRYVLARDPRFYQDRVFTAMPRNRKLIAWLNAKGLHGVSKILLNLSAKTK